MAKAAVAAILAGMLFAHMGAVGESGDWDVSGAVTAVSAYVWRGFVVDDGMVLQPELSIKTPRVGPGALVTSVWVNLDGTDTRTFAADEVDYILEYRVPWQSLELFAGHIYYDFPRAAASEWRGDREWYAGACAPQVLLSPRLTVYHNYDRGDGTYIELWGGHSFPLAGRRISLDTELRVAYNAGQYITGRGGDVVVKAGVTVPVRAGCYGTVFLAYSAPYGAMSDSDDGNQAAELFYGLKGGFSF